MGTLMQQEKLRRSQGQIQRSKRTEDINADLRAVALVSIGRVNPRVDVGLRLWRSKPPLENREIGPLRHSSQQNLTEATSPRLKFKSRCDIDNQIQRHGLMQDASHTSLEKL